jgi:hypothetical protein
VYQEQDLPMGVHAAVRQCHSALGVRERKNLRPVKLAGNPIQFQASRVPSGCDMLV